MEREWRCKNKACNTLLGVESGPRVHLRYKEAQYVVDGGDYVVTAVCRKCSTVNELRAAGDSPQPAAAGE